MIASDRRALKVGSALLIVDGTDESIFRKAELSISPTRAQRRRLRGVLRLSVDSYNAALEHRRLAWRWNGVSVSTYDQFKEITELRKVRPDITTYGNQVVRSSIRRVDEAFSSFFRRLGEGQTPGYPRFKSAKRWRTAFYDEPVSWAVKRIDGQTPVLYIQGVGEIALSKKATKQLIRLVERGGEGRTLTISETKTGSWRACVGFRGVSGERRKPSTEVGGVDRGITVTAALSDGTLLVMPRFLGEARRRIQAASSERERHEKGSAGFRAANKQMAKAYRKARQQTENWARHSAKEIVARYGVISLENLNLKNMTRSAKGTIAEQGKGVKQKQGLNRSLQETALGRLAFWICVRAEDAGRRVWKVDPRDSSRTCIACGHVDVANRKGTHFLCRRCGHHSHADVNAAQVLTSRAQAAEGAWEAQGRPLNERPKPRLCRRKKDVQGAGSAPHERDRAA